MGTTLLLASIDVLLYRLVGLKGELDEFCLKKSLNKARSCVLLNRLGWEHTLAIYTCRHPLSWLARLWQVIPAPSRSTANEYLMWSSPDPSEPVSWIWYGLYCLPQCCIVFSLLWSDLEGTKKVENVPVLSSRKGRFCFADGRRTRASMTLSPSSTSQGKQSINSIFERCSLKAKQHALSPLPPLPVK